MRKMMICVCFAALGACAHAKDTEGGGAREEGPKPTAPSAATESHTTKQMFKPEGLKAMQEALRDKVNLPVQTTGALDLQTEKALREYQKQQGIASTGMPDYQTIRSLGLKPDQVFRSEPPAKSAGVK